MALCELRSEDEKRRNHNVVQTKLSQNDYLCVHKASKLRSVWKHVLQRGKSTNSERVERCFTTLQTLTT